MNLLLEQLVLFSEALCLAPLDGQLALDAAFLLVALCLLLFALGQLSAEIFGLQA